MKIALISPSKDNLHHMTLTLQAAAHTVVEVEGGKRRMRGIAEQEQPNLMIVEGMCCDASELDHIEHVTTHFPNIAVILLCATTSPDFLLSAMRAGVREVLPSPVEAGVLLAAVGRVAAKLAATQQGPGTGKVLAFMPCKGGSGATFLATNFGYQLAESKNVLLIDLNLQFGDALSFVHDGKPPVTIADVARDIRRLDASFLGASAVRAAPNYSILAAPEDPAQAMEVKPEHVDAILKIAGAQYDFVLLDLPRTLDPVSIKALDRAYRIFPVIQASLPHLRNAARLIGVFRSLDYPADKVELIVNRFEKNGEIGLDAIRRSLGTHSMHTVPNSYKDVSTSINHGNALIQIAKSNAVARNLAEFALAMSPRQNETRGVFERLFKRA
ncbi:AAA family ATPase [Noviherbaspirillum galbum]|uniref:AAA family ATPase n=1 Tax=Noviherbaspirillum galbum TaxID=2709383 RepID=A0A6B3SJT1_9BURK|nr:AAA family ATPase [Noviherbaspirillum galbum]NEX61047.1 AAA family ATPase [Noviherbaspirillum galbum]